MTLPSSALDRRDLDALMQSWMAAVLGHHGRPPAEDGLTFPVFTHGARSRRDAAAFALDVKGLLDPPALAATIDDVDALELRMKRASWWLAGFAILCDWLGSDTQYFPYEDRPLELGEYLRTRAAPAAREAVRASGLVQARPRACHDDAPLFSGLVGRLTPLQRAAGTVDLGRGPRLFVLEDLTGSGKTEAALLLAHRLMADGRGDGLYFALPTMATANAMDRRIRPLVDKLLDGDPSYLLTHGGPRLTDRDRLALCGAGARGRYGAREAVHQLSPL